MNRPERSLKSMLSFGAAALLAFGAATAQVVTMPADPDPKFPGAAMIDSSGTYRGEVRACMSGMTQQDRETCLTEARNAQHDRMHNRLQPGHNFEANALARCNIFVGDDKAACQARVFGMGSIEGSVAGGGLLREVETVAMPAGESSVVVAPQTADPVVLIPETRSLGNR